MIKVKLHHGDCLEVMKSIQDKSIDLILTDPPYGTTACKWDVIIPFDLMWTSIKRVIKSNSAICLFSNQPFTSSLVSSNIKEYRHQWIWQKDQGRNFQNCKNQPLKIHEEISIFSKLPVKYYPQGLIKSGKIKKNKNKNGRIGHMTSEFLRDTYIQEWSNYPKTIQLFKSERGLHPTQKPVALLEYLIKTYTLEGETVLDFTMGSGSTGVACKNLNRNFIGIERDEKYFETAKNRIESTGEKQQELKEAQ